MRCASRLCCDLLQVLSGAIQVEKQSNGQFLLKHSQHTAALDESVLIAGIHTAVNLK